MKIRVHGLKRHDGAEHIYTIKVVQRGRNRSYVEHRVVLGPGDSEEVRVDNTAHQALVFDDRGDLLFTISP